MKASTRDADGNVTQAALGNGLTETTTRDAKGRVKRRTLTTGSETRLDLNMTFDLAGNLTQRASSDLYAGGQTGSNRPPVRTESFTYDNLNRLTQTSLNMNLLKQQEMTA